MNCAIAKFKRKKIALKSQYFKKNSIYLSEKNSLQHWLISGRLLEGLTVVIYRVFWKYFKQRKES